MAGGRQISVTMKITRINLSLRAFAVSVLAVIAVNAAWAGGPPAVVSARTVLSADGVHPGKTEKLAIVATVHPGYHINDHKPSLDYLIPTKVKFEKSPVVHLEQITYPQGKPKKFPFLDSPISVYEGEFQMRSTVRIERAAKPGTYVLHGKLTYQACNDHACLPPTSVALEVSVPVVSSSVPLKPANLEIFKKTTFK